MSDERHRGDAFSGPLRAALERSMSSAADDCPGAEGLAAYCDRALPPAERTAVEAHVSTCSRCQGLLAAVARADSASIASIVKPSPGWLKPARWLVPITAGGTALAVWLVVGPPGNEQPTDEVGAGNPRSEETRGPLEEKPVGTPDAELQEKAEPPLAKEERLMRKTTEPPTAPGDAVARRNEQADAATAGDATSLERRQRVDETQTFATLPDRAATSSPSTVREAEPGTPPMPPTTTQSQPASAPPSAAPRNAAGAAPQAYSVESRKRDSAAASQMEADQLTVAEATLEIQSSDPRVRWRVGPMLIRHTNNAGALWSDLEFVPRMTPAAGSSPSPLVCWVVGANGAVLRTIDGTGWERLPSPVPDDLIAIEATSANNAVVTARDGRQFVTGDGGRVWRPR